MKTSLLMFGLLLLGIGTAIVALYVDGILDDKKCNSNKIDIYIKILLGLSTACIVFSISYFMCIIRCGKDMGLIDIDGRKYLLVMALLCITTCVITALLHTELNNNSCDFNNIYTIVLISMTSLLFLICIVIIVISFYHFRDVSLEGIRQVNQGILRDRDQLARQQKEILEQGRNKAEAENREAQRKADDLRRESERANMYKSLKQTTTIPDRVTYGSSDDSSHRQALLQSRRVKESAVRRIDTAHRLFRQPVAKPIGAPQSGAPQAVAPQSGAPQAVAPQAVAKPIGAQQPQSTTPSRVSHPVV